MGVPIMVGQLGVILTGFVDNIMVGHHTTAELSAASFVNNIFMLPLMFATGFAMGITPLIGEQTGRNELPQAGQIFRYGLFANGILAASLILIMGTLYFFLDRMGLPQELLPLMRPYYLLHLIGLVPVLLFNAFKQFADGTTDTLTPMFILLSSILLNIIGNTVLIYGYAGFPEWGLFGAGVSTLTARIFTIVAGLCIFMYRKRYRRFKSGFFRLPSNRKLYRPILTMGIPVALQLGMETGSFSLSVIFIGRDIAEFFRDIDFTCFCLYRKRGKSFFRNAECNITKVTCKFIFSTERNIFCFYISIHHLNLTISKYSIIDFQITKIGTEFKIFEGAV